MRRGDGHRFADCARYDDGSVRYHPAWWYYDDTSLILVSQSLCDRVLR